MEQKGSYLYILKQQRKKLTVCQAWAAQPIIPACQTLRQEEQEFKVSLDYIASVSQKREGWEEKEKKNIKPILHDFFHITEENTSQLTF